MTGRPHPDPNAESTRDQQAVFRRLREAAGLPAPAADPDPEKAIRWVAGNIDKGFCRVHAVHLNEGPGGEGCRRLLEYVRRRIDDPRLLEEVRGLLAPPPDPELVSLVAAIALTGVDQILQQARALGREGDFLHVQCTRVGDALILLADRDARYDWILPAVQKRLREELAEVGYEPAAVEAQTLDLTLGHPLRFLDYELRLARDRHGEPRARYRLVGGGERRHAHKARSHPFGRYDPLRLLRPCLRWAAGRGIGRHVRSALGQASVVQVGWRHLPLTLYPVVAFLLGWRSPAAWLCLALIFVCNWRWPLGLARAAVAWARRNKLDTAMGACALGALVCLAPWVRDLYSDLSHEEAAPGLPPGFYLGRYSKNPLSDSGKVSYGLYVPPHFHEQKGPFPLIVFLHGHGERSEKSVFWVGLPRCITDRLQRFPASSRNGRFDFVAFFPIDPAGEWEAGSPGFEGALVALEYVVRRHRIDPARVYLTGHSAGGSGVWRMAEACPDRWAAVAPVCSFVGPDVDKVRHLPAWIFHGAKDPQAPVEKDRDLVRRLKEAKADVRYTELPNKGHIIWGEAYAPRELYDWFLARRKAG